MTTGHTPVLVGVAQLSQRVDDPNEARSPLELMIEAVDAAARDAGSRELLRRAGSVRVVKGIWGYRNPGRNIAEALGLARVETGLSVLGGNHVQLMVNRAALDLRDGRHEAVVLTGAECGRTLGQARKAGRDIEWLEPSDGDATPPPDEVYGEDRGTRHAAETARGLERAVEYYSLFEIALRHRAGETRDAHLERVSRLWADFAAVARGNPHAWIRREVSAEEIRTPGPGNRPITFPYPKLMNANMRVDMAAALVLCTEELARKLGIATDRFVYPLAGTDANDHYYVSERADLHSSPAIRIAGRRALELAGVELGDLDFVDLYSCFPSAVQVAAHELGLEADRPLTVTGGLTFHGGPLNNYVMHAIARTVELLRERARRGDNARALVTANGGMLTKHAFGVYGTEPARSSPDPGGNGNPEYRYENLQAAVDREPRREVAESARGSATLESYVVVYGAPASPRGASPPSPTSLYGGTAPRGDEPAAAYLACRLPDGRRCWSTTRHPEALAVLVDEDPCGSEVRLRADGSAALVG